MDQTTAQDLQIARSFAKDFASRFDMPELAKAAEGEWDGNIMKNRIICVADIQPNGQISALVSSLHVEVSFGQSKEGLFYASVRLSYRHISGGSNGHSDDYRIITRKDLSRKTSYLGFLHCSLEYEAMLENKEAQAKEKA